MLVLYEATVKEPIRSAEIRLAEDGTAKIRVLSHSSYTDAMAAGVPSLELRRKVLPDEGQLFIDTLTARASRSTYWYIEEEPDANLPV